MAAGHRFNLEEVVAVRAQWPTPRANQAMAATIRNGMPQRDPKYPNLENAVAKRTDLPATGGKLNPTWTEWLMGWPLDWTDCAASVTDKYREWLQQHGESSRGGLE